MRVRILIVVLGLAGGSGLMAAEQKIQKKDVPAAVLKALEPELHGATVKGYEKEVEHGKTFYEVETTKDGRSRDILFDGAGAVVEVEEELAPDAAPAAVTSALAAHGHVTKIEAVTKGGRTIYEGHFAKGAKRSEVKVTADGQPVKN